MNHIVNTAVTMGPISEENQLQRACQRKSASEKEGMKIRKEDDDYIMNEIKRKEVLEDPDYKRFDNEEAAAVLVAKSTETIA